MRILTNMPLEAFAPRCDAAWGGIELVTYGPGRSASIDGREWPYDIAFDASTGSIEALLASCPERPDVLVIWWPDQQPIPDGLARCPIPVVGIISDYNLTLPYIAALWPHFDLWLCDRGGVELFDALSFETRHFVQYAPKIDHVGNPDAHRPIDVAFAGNLNPRVQAERAPWIERVRALSGRGHEVAVETGVWGPAYGLLVGNAKIGFNRSIRSEMNLRAFEVPACGALGLIEAGNTEADDCFVPGEEIVLYGDADGELEDVVARYLGDDAERRRIARNGQERVRREHTMAHRMHRLLQLVDEAADTIPGVRARHVEQAGEYELDLSRAVAMLLTWTPGPVIGDILAGLHRQRPDDPRPINALAHAHIKTDSGPNGIGLAVQAWRAAAAVDARYLPPAVNLAALLRHAGRHEEADDLVQRHVSPRIQSIRDAAACGDDVWSSIDGTWFPVGFSEFGIACSHALADAVRGGSVEPVLDVVSTHVAPAAPVTA